jgi:transcription elongation factor GreA
MSTVVPRSVLMTKEGYERLQAELQQLVGHERRAIAEWLRDARSGGGEPGDHAEVTAAIEKQAALERRIREIEATLASASIARPVAGVAGVGQVVRLRIAGSSTVLAYHLVSPAESDPRSGRVSVESPIGQALVGGRAGDVFDVKTPRGTQTVEIIDVVDAGDSS